MRDTASLYFCMYLVKLNANCESASDYNTPRDESRAKSHRQKLKAGMTIVPTRRRVGLQMTLIEMRFRDR